MLRASFIEIGWTLGAMALRLTYRIGLELRTQESCVQPAAAQSKFSGIR